MNTMIHCRQSAAAALLAAVLAAGCSTPPPAPPPLPAPPPAPGWKDPDKVEYVGPGAATYAELSAAADALVRRNALIDANLRAAVERRRAETGRTPTIRIRVDNVSTVRHLEKLNEAVRNVKDAFRAAGLFNVKDDATADFTFRAELRDFLDGSRHTFRIGATITERASRTEVWSGTATFAK